MKRVEIAPKYSYIKFDTDVLMYAYLDSKLKKGYKITDSVFLCVEICVQDTYELLSFIEIEPIDSNIKETIYKMFPPKELVLPKYDKTPLNLIASIRSNFGYSSKFQSLDLGDKKYKKVVLLILDGLGCNILKENLEEDSFLRKHQIDTLTSIYPSTTAASTVSIKSGLAPIETGWLGWQNYFKEFNRNVILFTGVNYYTDEATGVDISSYLPYSMFYSDMKEVGCSIEPDFKSGKYDLSLLFKQSKKINSQIQYIYYPQPDDILHKFGPYSIEARKCLKEIDRVVKQYAESLDEDTLFCITADHGHIGVEALSLYACPMLLDLLKRAPSNDARCMTFCVKEGCHLKFEELFQALFGSVYQLYKSEDAIKLGFFGSGTPHPRCKDFLADYVAIGTHSYYLNSKGVDAPIMKSHHAGITKEEMQVPLILGKR